MGTSHKLRITEEIHVIKGNNRKSYALQLISPRIQYLCFPVHCKNINKCTKTWYWLPLHAQSYKHTIHVHFWKMCFFL